MAKSVPADARFHNEVAAFAYVEAELWPNGPVCPHCENNGDTAKIGRLQGKTTRPGLYKCYGCRKPFTVRIGTIFEDSHLALHLWLQAIHLLCSSKKGISILLVPNARRRKAEEMLARAGVQYNWGNPPTAEEIRQLDRERLLKNPILSEENSEDDLTMADMVLGAHDPRAVAAAFVKLYRAQFPAPEEIIEAYEPRPERGGRAAQAAVGKELHGVDPQPIRKVTTRGQRHRADAIDETQRHHVDPNRQPALAVEPPVGLQ